MFQLFLYSWDLKKYTVFISNESIKESPYIKFPHDFFTENSSPYPLIAGDAGRGDGEGVLVVPAAGKNYFMMKKNNGLPISGFLSLFPFLSFPQVYNQYCRLKLQKWVFRHPITIWKYLQGHLLGLDPVAL